MKIWDEVITKLNLYWQYPVITEKTVYNQQYNNINYLGIPWATILDNRNTNKYNINDIVRNILPLLTNKHYITCCQHISFREIIPLFKVLKIKTLYTPHKIKGENSINGIEILACPLYAINFEDNERNSYFKDKDFLTYKRNLLYSFIGGYQPDYLTDIRLKIFNLKHPENTFIKHTGDWHFNCNVYDVSQGINGKLNENDEHKNKTQTYNETLVDSIFSLCPSGTGPNSIRFWESLACGSIPVLLTDTLDLPQHDLWNDAILTVQEKDVNNIPKLLDDIPEEKILYMRKNCLKIYNDFKDNFLNLKVDKPIVHYCDGCYEQRIVGGVARYDYQIKLAFPNRKFFRGPREREEMIRYLEQFKDPIVITDNHLSCDIPNKYRTYLVHHGSAKTTALRNPDWGEPYRSLCCNGQDKMLDYRDQKTTTILSISQSCTDDFTKYYGDKYLKFNRIPMLHPSELDEARFKTTFNVNPLVLGNWEHIKKGKNLIPQLKSNIKNFTFNQLNVKITQAGVEDFNRRKQDIYLNNDIFLQISNSEGNSYATLDALICGMVVVSSNVGLFYKDVPDDCFVRLEWEKNGDAKYVQEKLEYAWKHREKLSKNAREWYMNNCRFIDWKNKMHKLIK